MPQTLNNEEIAVVSPPQISVIIPNYNGARYLEGCLGSLQAQRFRAFEIIVVDNASIDNSADVVARLAPGAKFLRGETNAGFAAAVNSGLRSAVGEWVAVLNNDTEVSPEWLCECASAIGRHAYADFLACRILEFRTRTLIFSAGDCFLRAGIGYRRGQELQDRDEYRQERSIFAACGCAALYRKSVLESLGGFDERFFAYLEDVDLGLRLQASGCRGIYVPGAEVYHHGGGTSGGEFSSTAARLHTRNAVLLLLKAFPARILLRCLPMIVLYQTFWLARVLLRRRLFSYLSGLAAVFPLLPAMLRERKNATGLWKDSEEKLWNAILESEALAAMDCRPPGKSGSMFLRWYVRLFGCSHAGAQGA